MPAELTGRVVDIDAFLDAQPRDSGPYAVEFLKPHGFLPQNAFAWPREGGLPIEELLSWRLEWMLLLNCLDNAIIDAGLNEFLRRYNCFLNYDFCRELNIITDSPEAIQGVPYRRVIDAFIKKGYLRYTGGYENLPDYTIQAIRDVLRAHEIRVGGKKDEVIERVKKNFTPEEVDQFFPAKRVFLTPQGKELLEYHGYLFFFLAYQAGLPAPLKLQGLREQRKAFPFASARDVSFKILQDMLNKALSEDNGDHIESYRVILLLAAYCLEYFDMTPDSAIYYALVCYLDIGAAKEYPSTDCLHDGIVSDLREALVGRDIREDFLREAERLKTLCSPDFLPPPDAWNMIASAIGA